MKTFNKTAALIFFCNNVSIPVACFVTNRNLKSNVLTTRVKNLMSDRDISMNLMIPYSSFESIHQMVSLAIQNPNIEAELFRDLAHAALDIATLCSINPIVLRIIIFIGRLFSNLDYLCLHYRADLSTAILRSWFLPPQNLYPLRIGRYFLLYSNRPVSRGCNINYLYPTP